jgi:hypothetical protein
MHRRTLLKTLAAGLLSGRSARIAARQTSVSIQGDRFLINGRPTYEGRSWRGMRIEGLLMNSRMVQGIFDDLNPGTRARWAYPDTKQWDAERNTREFIAAMPEWRRHGLLSFTINLQGGSPEGYSREQPWHNNAFQPDGSLRPDYLGRLERILDRADELGMAPIVGYFYFGQVQRLENDTAVRRGVREATTWLLKLGYRNVLARNRQRMRQPQLRAAARSKPRVHELIELAQSITLTAGAFQQRQLQRRVHCHRRASPRSRISLLHGNGVPSRTRLPRWCRTRAPARYRMPISSTKTTISTSTSRGTATRPSAGIVSWGYFDFRMAGEGADE